MASHRGQVRFLATSREPLRLRGEAVIDVPALEAEDADALFRDRAGLQGDVRDIVDRLDRIPLALELAACHAGQGLDALRRHLDDALALRTTWRDVEPRHATLRAAIDASWALLDDAHRDAFARCSVFRGGFTTEAACEVLDIAPAVLRDLAARSMIRRRGDRWVLFESLHAYASERLGSDVALQDRHAACFAGLATDLDRVLTSPDHGRALRMERANLEVALEHALRAESPLAAPLGLTLAAACEDTVRGVRVAALLQRVLDLGVGDRIPLKVARGQALRLAWRPDEARRELAEAVAAADGAHRGQIRQSTQATKALRLRVVGLQVS